MDGWIYMVQWTDRPLMNVACKSQKIFHSRLPSWFHDWS